MGLVVSLLVQVFKKIVELFGEVKARIIFLLSGFVFSLIFSVATTFLPSEVIKLSMVIWGQAIVYYEIVHQVLKLVFTAKDEA